MAVEERGVNHVHPDADVAVEVIEDLKVEQTPLPKLQLFIVFLIQFAEPVTAMVIYPFVNQLVRETGITGGNEAKTGYYAGIVESMFFLCETLTVFAWGWLSDQFGRKPILLLGPLGLSVSMLSFGLSKSYWPLVYSRACQGLFNGNIGVSKSVIAEITDSTNVGDAFALIPLMWATGSTIGPMLGGVLSNPATRWPGTFGHIQFLRDYPYALPCAAASAIAFLSFALSSIALKETLPVKRGALRDSWGRRLIRKLSPSPQKDACSRAPLLQDPEPIAYGSTTTEAALPVSEVEDDEAKPGLSDLFVPAYTWTIVNYGCFTFVDMAIFALIPLVYSTPIEYGGLGMDPFKIGVILGSFGMINGLLCAVTLGPLMRRWGPTTVYKRSILGLFISFSAFPIQNALARRAGCLDIYVAAVVLLQFAAQFTLSPCYAAMSVLVVKSCPHKRLMGSANGAAQMITSGSRVIAPTLASSLFSISIQHNLAGGRLVYYIGLLLVAGLVYLSRYLR